MNKHKQSKSSIIIQTCWISGGASPLEVSDAIEDAGFWRLAPNKLLHTLKSMQRKGWLYLSNEKWHVAVPAPKEAV